MNGLGRFNAFKEEIKKMEERRAKRTEKRTTLPHGQHERINKKKKRISSKDADARAWSAMSKFIRQRDRLVGCIGCGARPENLGPGKWQAGHGISRRKRATKFDEANVFGMCQPCNWKDRFQPGYHDHIIERISHRIGWERYGSNVRKSGEVCQHGTQELLDIEIYFEAKYQQLLNDPPCPI